MFFRFVKSLDNSITNALADGSSNSVAIASPSESTNGSTKMNVKLATNSKLTPEIQNLNPSSSSTTDTKISSNASLNSGMTSPEGPTHKNEEDRPNSSSLRSHSSNSITSEKSIQKESLKRHLLKNKDTLEGSEIPSKKILDEKSENKNGADPSTSQESGANEESRGSYDELD